jgi:hypothetical protein
MRIDAFETAERKREEERLRAANAAEAAAAIADAGRARKPRSA